MQWPALGALALASDRRILKGDSSLWNIAHHVRVDRLRRRLVRRRRALDQLGLFHSETEIAVDPGQRLHLPVRVEYWRAHQGDPASPQWDETKPRYLSIPDAYLPWLEPEELRWLQSLVMADTPVSNVRERAEDITIRFGAKAMVGVVAAAVGATAAVAKVLAG